MQPILLKITTLLNRKERRQAGWLLLLILLMSLVEMVGVASILPFISVLADPSQVEENALLRQIYAQLGFKETQTFLFALGCGALLILVIGSMIKAATRWLTLYYSHKWGQSISCRLLERYLEQPYGFFLKRNSADLAKNILAEIHALTNNVIVLFLDMIARIFVSVLIFALLLFIDPILAISALIILGGAYGIIYIFFRKILASISNTRKISQATRYKIVNEAIHGIKNIKLMGFERLYVEQFNAPAKDYAISNASGSAIGDIPRYALELIAFGGILLITLYLLIKSQNNLGGTLPIIALYAFAGYRLMPGLQGIYGAITKIRFHLPILDTVIDELSLPQKSLPRTDAPPIALRYEISLENISFSYDDQRGDILHNVSIKIPSNRNVAIIGKTGAGKTTLVDLILGLLAPSSGRILIDETPIDAHNMHQWQKNLSYVSQHIYLCDDTIARNIAFGLSQEQIDLPRVKQAAMIANLSDFIETALPDGYDTKIGENGIQLSGGQRQRIGLARALYFDRPVLVLDEATSALDPETENAVMQSIQALRGRKTIIMISHRETLLAYCDAVYTVANKGVKLTTPQKSQAQNEYDKNRSA